MRVFKLNIVTYNMNKETDNLCKYNDCNDRPASQNYNNLDFPRNNCFKDNNLPLERSSNNTNGEIMKSDMSNKKKNSDLIDFSNKTYNNTYGNNMSDSINSSLPRNENVSFFKKFFNILSCYKL